MRVSSVGSRLGQNKMLVSAWDPKKENRNACGRVCTFVAMHTRTTSHTRARVHTHTHTMQCIQHNNPGGNRALHWTASARQSSKNNGCDIVMWLGAFLQCKAKRGSVGKSGPNLALRRSVTVTQGHPWRLT
jgi:hypothetical protein